jgi:hypothetical protein
MIDLNTPTFSTSTITYIWSVDALRTHDQGTYTNIVSEVDWRLTGTIISGDATTSTSLTGTIQLKFNPDRFTEYSGLKASQVISWITNHIGHTGFKPLQATIKGVLLPLASPALPW